MNKKYSYDDLPIISKFISSYCTNFDSILFVSIDQRAITILLDNHLMVKDVSFRFDSAGLYQGSSLPYTVAPSPPFAGKYL